MRRVVLAACALLVVSGCRSGRAKAEADIERALGVQLPPDFEVVQDEWSVAPGDMVVTYEVTFSPEAFARLERRLDLGAPWVRLAQGYQRIDSLDTNESVTLFLNPEERSLRYQYAEV